MENTIEPRRPDPAKIICRALEPADLDPHMMDAFDRTEEITHILHKGKPKRLRKPRLEQWDDDGKTKFIKHWFIANVYIQRHYDAAPMVFCALQGGQVKGFAVWWPDGGDYRGYAVLARLYISADCRRRGLGGELFRLCAAAARADGYKKMYISASPSVATQAFYQAMGCISAKTDLRKAMHSPQEDVPLEVALGGGGLPL
ncbi:MAG: GNAT family N-acetyltransferase [Oscillospiraceae bacterium]|nr:GNAT family N-acetyltransferase [Oscillospiraceae bacterium]